jgi:hypothetical protein
LVYCLSGCPYENSHGSTGKVFDFSHYATMSLAVYLLIGFMITVVVQSSSVTMALTLSALHVYILAYRCRHYIGVANRNYQNNAAL